MASLNKVMLIGNIGNVPEARTMPNGDAVAHFRVASTEGWTDRATGERKEHTEWHSIACYRGLAEFVRDYLGKGRQVHVEGKLRTSKWTDKAGIERYSTEIIADSVQPLGPRPEGVQGRSNDKGGEATAADRFAESDDDLPY